MSQQGNWGGSGPGGWGGGGGYGGPPPDYYGPPAGGGWPPGGFTPPTGLAPQRPSAIKERNSAVVLLLALVTCGVYFFYWVYATSLELQQQTGDTSINPGLDLLLSLVTCGMWGIYTQYRNTQKVHACVVAYNPHHKDQSQTVLILNIASFFVGFTSFIAMYVVQEELNLLARSGGPALPR